MLLRLVEELANLLNRGDQSLSQIFEAKIVSLPEELLFLVEDHAVLWLLLLGKSAAHTRQTFRAGLADFKQFTPGRKLIDGPEEKFMKDRII